MVAVAAGTVDSWSRAAKVSAAAAVAAVVCCKACCCTFRTRVSVAELKGPCPEHSLR